MPVDTLVLELRRKEAERRVLQGFFAEISLVEQMRRRPPEALFSPPPVIGFQMVESLRAQQPEQAQLPENYAVFVNDGTVTNPFSIDNGLLRIIQREVRGVSGQEARARRVFDWMQGNIVYDYAFYHDLTYRGPHHRDYSTSLETLHRGEGVCGEQAFLYIAMARTVGLKAGYVYVKCDYTHRKVDHGCASVDVERGRILVDPAYQIYDVKHCKYEFLSDKQVIEYFQHWREG